MSAILIFLSGFSHIIVPVSAVLFIIGSAMVGASVYLTDETEDDAGIIVTGNEPETF